MSMIYCPSLLSFPLVIQEGDFAKIEALLKRRNETIFSLDVRDKETGNTALIWAAKRGHSKVRSHTAII